MTDIHLLARVYLHHPGTVGLPTNRRDLYNPPPLDRAQIKEFSKRWGIPLKRVPPEWGTVMSPILLAMHLEVEGSQPQPLHTECIIQYILWNYGDRLLMWLLLMARARPPEIPRRTFFWYLQRYNLQVKDIQSTGMMYPNHRDDWVWTIPEARKALEDVSTMTLDWYRLVYLMGRGTIT